MFVYVLFVMVIHLLINSINLRKQISRSVSGSIQSIPKSVGRTQLDFTMGPRGTCHNTTLHPKKKKKKKKKKKRLWMKIVKIDDRVMGSP